MKKNKVKSTKKKSLPIWVWASTVLLLVAVVIGVVLSQQNRTASTALPTEISVDQAAQKRDQGAFILDVREPSEWADFHIPGATLIPLGELPNRLSEVPKDREVVVVCRTGRRSAQGRDILLKAGYPQVTSMAGGVTQWQAQGLPIATGQ
jgi:rhodanese-related sulfurtransferase